MIIQFIVFSLTGHTKTVSEAAKGKLRKSGHNVVMDYIQPMDKLDLKAEIVEVKEIPDPHGYDLVIIGSPVHGGRVSAPIRTFLSQVSSLEGIRIVLLVTHFFRPGWGALQTLQELQQMCESKGGEVIGDIRVKWFSLIRKGEIKKAIDYLCSLIDN